ncbi:MAG: hypothetical protein COT91_00325 [Candidatus Doudnabacteria bacterium CG10_big_fil_rev_8_21_14_0_10_41_10]|uniref:Lycopene cyclase domain-containing protein n=1 Tax=Candidatus Doudnabacteria bacterium CG10_big_fil_rev_8_21_14_0_10_41_10 TaxID=1974551 RepID=A0A2H0VEY4_9BACT|nr:MAG: hypothetical protein COT91_00325 [Candidatus Doudnabacteria bacterium CG10_big_fil_rev_8_21_14_0_10_41_10]
MSKKKFDFLVVLILLIATAWLSLVFKPKPLTGGLLYTLLPSVYLLLRENKNYKKLILGTFVFGVLFGFFFYFIETFNKAWVVPNMVIPYKVFGILPFDDILGFMIMTFFMLVFYEHFLDDEKNFSVSPHIYKALIPTFLLVLIVMIVFLVNPSSLNLTHAYLKGGIAAIIFPLVFAFRKPCLIGKLSVATIFFFSFGFCLRLWR